MQFEPTQTSEILGPLITEQALSDVPIFGPEKSGIVGRISSALKDSASVSATVEHVDEISRPLPDSFFNATSITQKLKSIRAYVRDEQADQQAEDEQHAQENGPKHLDNRPNEISLASNSLVSCREIHEALLGTLATVKGLPREAQCVVDHSMLLRAKEKYLFDAATNRTVLSDDSWRRFLWDWVAGMFSLLSIASHQPSIWPDTLIDAEMAADDGGMLLGNMDLSYLGVHSIWTNDLGTIIKVPPQASSTH